MAVFLIITMAVLVILGYILIVRWYILRALHKFIIPELEARKLIFVKYKYLLLPPEKFGNKNRYQIFTIYHYQDYADNIPAAAMYIDIYYKKNPEDASRKVTAKIYLVLSFIRKVEYSEFDLS